MNFLKKLKEKIILIKIEKEKARKEKFLKEMEIKERKIRMEVYEKYKNNLLKQREELINSILSQAYFAELTEERYLELINDYENPNEYNKANLYGILSKAYNIGMSVANLKDLDKSINELDCFNYKKEEKEAEIIKI